MSFFPNIDYKPHKELEELICKKCEKYNIHLLTVPQYYYLNEKEVKEYKELFSNESLLIRSAADLLLVGVNHTTLLDCKTTYREGTGNIAIELSSYHWNLQHNRDGVEFYYCYKDGNEIKIFAPRKNPPDYIYIQPIWKKYPPIEKLFQKYTYTIEHFFKNHKIKIYTERDTGGSRDPFIIIKKKKLKTIFFNEYLRNRYQKPLFDYLPIRVPYMEVKK